MFPVVGEKDKKLEPVLKQNLSTVSNHDKGYK
jgi:hypothetical protein